MNKIAAIIYSDKSKTLTANEKSILVNISTITGGASFIIISYKRISESTNLSLRTVKRLIESLCEKGFLKKHKRTQTGTGRDIANAYTINVKKLTSLVSVRENMGRGVKIEEKRQFRGVGRVTVTPLIYNHTNISNTNTKSDHTKQSSKSSDDNFKKMNLEQKQIYNHLTKNGAKREDVMEAIEHCSLDEIRGMIGRAERAHSIKPIRSPAFYFRACIHELVTNAKHNAYKRIELNQVPRISIEESCYIANRKHFMELIEIVKTEWEKEVWKRAVDKLDSEYLQKLDNAA